MSPDAKVARTTLSASDAPDAPAPTRLGRFVVLDPIGAGGMGSVYSAWDRQLERRVAIKILHSDDRERFLREAQALARLSHPNVVTVYDVGSADGRDFIAMELIEGMSLRRWLVLRRHPWREILAAFLAAGRGLAAVHAVGIVHRDIKPDNMLRAHDGTVRIADFGLARAFGAQASAPDPRAQKSELLATAVTDHGAILGTPRYMAPEQRAGQDPGPGADQYSFCLSLYEALFGRRPGDDEPPLPAALGRIPRALRQALERGLAQEPAARFASMLALLSALNAVAVRRRWAAALAAALAVVAVCGLAVWHRSVGPAASCRGAGDFTGAWREDDRSALRAAFVATGARGAAKAADATLSALDGYAGQVASMAAEACAAARIDHIQSEDTHELRGACLRRRLAEMRALARELGKPDAQIVRGAADAAASLPPVAGCADVEALSSPTSVPAAPEQRAAVAALQSELDSLEAASLAGRYRESLERADADVARARAIGFRPQISESLDKLAFLQLRLGSLAAAETTLEATAAEAQAAGHDIALARAAAKLVYVVGYDGRRAADARRWAVLAAATLDRYQAAHGGSAEADALRVRLEVLLADLERTAGRFAESEAHARRGVELARKLDAGSRSATDALRALAAILQVRGHLEEAEELALRAITLKTMTGELGDALASIYMLLGSIKIEQHRWLEARQQLESAVALAGEVLEKENLSVARAQTKLGVVDEALHDYPRALAEFGRARAVYLAHFGPGSPKVAATLALEAGPLLRLRRTAEARAALVRALEIDEKAAPQSPDIAAVLAQLSRLDADEGRLGAAIAEADRALAITEKVNPGGREMVGRLQAAASAHRREPKKALALLTRAAAKAQAMYGQSPELALVLDELGLAASRAGEVAQARDSLERGLSMAPDSISSAGRLTLGELYFRAGEKDRARPLLEASINGAEREGKPDIAARARSWLARR